MAKFIQYVGVGGMRVLETPDLETLGIKTSHLSRLEFHPGVPVSVTNAVAEVLTNPSGRTAGEFILVSDETVEIEMSQKEGDPNLGGAEETDQSISGGPSHDDSSLGSSESAIRSEVGVDSRAKSGRTKKSS